MAQEYDHFAYGLDLTGSMKLFVPSNGKAFHKAPNSDSLASIHAKLSDINYPVLVAVDGRDSSFRDNGAEALLKKPQYFFMLLKWADSDDADAILTAQELCEQNALQIQAKLIFDDRKKLNGVRGLELDSFTIGSIGPIGDGLYGVIMGFTLEHGISYKIDPDFWNAES